LVNKRAVLAKRKCKKIMARQALDDHNPNKLGQREKKKISGDSHAPWIEVKNRPGGRRGDLVGFEGERAGGVSPLTEAVTNTECEVNIT